MDQQMFEKGRKFKIAGTVVAVVGALFLAVGAALFHHGQVLEEKAVESGLSFNEHAIGKDCVVRADGTEDCGTIRNALTYWGQSQMLSSGLAGTWYVRLYACPTWTASTGVTSGNLYWNNKASPPVMMAAASTGTAGATNPTTMSSPAGTYNDGTITYNTLAIAFDEGTTLGCSEAASNNAASLCTGAGAPNACCTAAGVGANCGYPGGVTSGNVQGTTFGTPAAGTNNCAGASRNCYQSVTTQVSWLAGSSYTQNLNMAALCTTVSGTAGHCIAILGLSSLRNLNSGDTLSFTDTTYMARYRARWSTVNGVPAVTLSPVFAR